MKAFCGCILGLVIIVAAIVYWPYLYVGAVIGITSLTTRPGIGPVEQAQDEDPRRHDQRGGAVVAG